MEIEKVLAMAVAAVAEETKADTRQVRVLSFREIKKSGLAQYLADHDISYHKYQLEDAKV